MRDAKATPRGGFVLSERAVRSAQLELGAARTAARAKLARGRSSSQACARVQFESGLRAGAVKTSLVRGYSSSGSSSACWKKSREQPLITAPKEEQLINSTCGCLAMMLST